MGGGADKALCSLSRPRNPGIMLDDGAGINASAHTTWGRVCAAPAADGNIFAYCPSTFYSREKCSRRACESARPFARGVQHLLHAPARPDLTVIITIAIVRCEPFVSYCTYPPGVIIVARCVLARRVSYT